MKVWMVHVETGEYSGWDFRVCGVFSDYDMARDYVMSRTVPIGEFGNLLDDFDIGDKVATKVPIERAMDHFVVKDDRYEPRSEDWYITEYELDKGAKLTRSFGHVCVGFSEDEGEQDEVCD